MNTGHLSPKQKLAWLLNRRPHGWCVCLVIWLLVWGTVCMVLWPVEQLLKNLAALDSLSPLLRHVAPLGSFVVAWAITRFTHLTSPGKIRRLLGESLDEHVNPALRDVSADLASYLDKETEIIGKFLQVDEVLAEFWNEAFVLGRSESVWHAALMRCHATLERASLPPYLAATADSGGKGAIGVKGKSSPARAIDDVREFLDWDFLANSRSTVPVLDVAGKPGSGKSVLLWHLFGEAVLRLRAKGHGWAPLLVFGHEIVEAMTEAHTFKDFLVRYFNGRTGKEASYQDACRKIASFVEDKYEKIQFLVIIDALDEVEIRSKYSTVVQRLGELLKQEALTARSCPNRVIVSCREDDDYDLLGGDHLRLSPQTFSDIKNYLRELQKFWRGRLMVAAKERKRVLLSSQISDREADYRRYLTSARSSLRGIRRSSEAGLLRNYMGNAYLCARIAIYYRDEKSELTGFLKEVFDQVLEREINRHRRSHPQRRPVDREHVVYLREVMAPLCFVHTCRTADGMPQDDEYYQALKLGIGIGGHLFAAEDGLARFYQTGESSGIRRAFDHWRHLPEAELLLQTMAKMRGAAPDVESFERAACDWLLSLTLKALDEGGSPRWMWGRADGRCCAKSNTALSRTTLPPRFWR